MTNTKINLPTEHCETCPAFYQLEQMGIKVGDFDRVVALAGNPNTGKSTLLNHVKLLYDAQDVGTISNMVEKQFGLGLLAGM